MTQQNGLRQTNKQLYEHALTKQTNICRAKGISYQHAGTSVIEIYKLFRLKTIIALLSSDCGVFRDIFITIRFTSL